MIILQFKLNVIKTWLMVRFHHFFSTTAEKVPRGNFSFVSHRMKSMKICQIFLQITRLADQLKCRKSKPQLAAHLSSAFIRLVVNELRLSRATFLNARLAEQVPAPRPEPKS